MATRRMMAVPAREFSVRTCPDSESEGMTVTATKNHTTNYVVGHEARCSSDDTRMEGYTTEEFAESRKISSEARDVVVDDAPPTIQDSALVRNRRDVIGHEVRHSSVDSRMEACRTEALAESSVSQEVNDDLVLEDNGENDGEDDNDGVEDQLFLQDNPHIIPRSSKCLASVDWEDSNSVRKVFPVWKKRGTLNVPNILLRNVSTNKAKAKAVYSWRRLTHGQQKKWKEGLKREEARRRVKHGRGRKKKNVTNSTRGKETNTPSGENEAASALIGLLNTVSHNEVSLFILYYLIH
jgi:hypothetical protein